MVYAYLQFFSFNLLLLFKPVDKTHNHAENIEDGLVRVVIVLKKPVYLWEEFEDTKGHEWGKDRKVFTTSGTYLWLFVTRIFHNSQPSYGGNRKTFEVMTSI
jgi:hypothetical protein